MMKTFSSRSLAALSAALLLMLLGCPPKQTSTRDAASEARPPFDVRRRAAESYSPQFIYDVVNGRDVATLNRLLEAGVDANTSLPDGSYALVIATHWTRGLGGTFSTKGNPRRGRVFSAEEQGAIEDRNWSVAVAMTRALLDHGARVNVADRFGATPLMNACSNGPPGTDIMDMLLARGADTNASDPKTGEAPLHICAVSESPHLIRRLIKAGARVDARAESGSTPLMGAAATGNLENVRALLAAGADPILKDDEGETAYDRARSYKYPAIARVLKQAMRARPRDAAP